MIRIHPLAIALAVILGGILLPEFAFAYSPLQCNAGAPQGGTSLFDDSSNGACQFTGIQYMFSTVICQFVTMINVVLGKLYCGIQFAVQPVIYIVMLVFIIVYGVQMLMGTAQLNSGELITRIIKMSIIFWLATDQSWGVSAGIGLMFKFFVAFISESTRWVVSVLSAGSGLNFNLNQPYNPGITATFYYLDEWIFSALTGALSSANAKVMGFFVAMSMAMPSVFFLVLYWLISVLKMVLMTLVTFLMAIVAVAFLLAMSPIFLSFMLFKATFQFFDQWLRFMVAFSLQVMVSFAVLTLWLFSLTMFAPFFNEISEVVFPYNKIIRPAAAIYNPAETWGLCPLDITANPIPTAKCKNNGFNPQEPEECTNQTHPGGCYYSNNIKKLIPAADKTTKGTTNGNGDYREIIPPSRIPELKDFVFYVFYHMLTLIVVSYGFASLQKHSSSIAKQLAGPNYTPILNASGIGNANFGSVRGAQGEAKRFMSKDLFSSFDRRHEVGATPYEQMIRGAGKMVGNR
jgi:hypothetical protein